MEQLSHAKVHKVQKAADEFIYMHGWNIGAAGTVLDDIVLAHLIAFKQSIFVFYYLDQSSRWYMDLSQWLLFTLQITEQKVRASNAWRILSKHDKKKVVLNRLTVNIILTFQLPFG